MKTRYHKLFPAGLENAVFMHENKIIGVILLVYAVLPLVIKNNVVVNIATYMLQYMLLASALNIINGYSGQFNLGAAGFYCIGAYTAAICSTKFGWSIWVLLPVSGMAAVAVSLLLAFPTSRLRKNYFSIVTLAFSELIRQVAINWIGVTNGPSGITNIPTPSLFGLEIKRNIFFYYLILILVLVMLFCTNRIIKSRVGLTWMSIRENIDAASSLGVKTAKYKTINLAYSAFWAGVVGCFFAFFQRYVSPNSFGAEESYNILAMNIIGGQGTLLGPLVGAMLVNLITEALRSTVQLRMMLYAVAIIAMMWLRPQGILGTTNRQISSSADEDTDGPGEEGEKQGERKEGVV